MARTEQQELRREVREERARLVEAVDELRGEAANLKARIRAKVPIAAAGALALGFLKAGGPRRVARLLHRK